jgi:hypothetical protein
VQVGKAAGPELPDFLTACYAAVSVFQLDNIATPPSCSKGSYEFAFQVVLMTFGLVVAAVACLAINKRTSTRLFGKRAALAGWGTVTALKLLYPIVTNAVLGLLTCSRIKLTGAQYKLLNHDSWRDSDISDVVVSDQWQVLTANRYYVCYEGQHLPAVSLALVALVLLVILFPVVSFALAYHRIRAIIMNDDAFKQMVLSAEQLEAERLKDASHGSSVIKLWLVVLGPQVTSWWSKRAAAHIHGNPMNGAAAETSPDSNAAREDRSDLIIDKELVVKADPLLKVFATQDYRPSTPLSIN